MILSSSVRNRSGSFYATTTASVLAASRWDAETDAMELALKGRKLAKRAIIRQESRPECVPGRKT